MLLSTMSVLDMPFSRPSGGTARYGCRRSIVRWVVCGTTLVVVGVSMMYLYVLRLITGKAFLGGR